MTYWGLNISWQSKYNDDEGSRDFILVATEEETEALADEINSLNNMYLAEARPRKPLTIAEFRVREPVPFMVDGSDEDEE